MNITAARCSIPRLSEFVQVGVPTLLWVGDKEYPSPSSFLSPFTYLPSPYSFLCNYIGILAVAKAIEYEGKSAFKIQELQEWVDGGSEYGGYKVRDNLLYLQLYNGGHNLQYGCE